MKALLLASACYLCFAVVTQARIGETPEQNAARYGEALEHGVVPIHLLPTFVVEGHRKNGFRIFVHYTVGKADWIRIYKEAGDHEFTADEIAFLLTADSGGKVWKTRTRGTPGDELRMVCERPGVMMQLRAEKDQPPYMEFITSAALDTMVAELQKRQKALETMRFENTQQQFSGF